MKGVFLCFTDSCSLHMQRKLRHAVEPEKFKDSGKDIVLICKGTE